MEMVWKSSWEEQPEDNSYSREILKLWIRVIVSKKEWLNMIRADNFLQHVERIHIYNVKLFA